MSRAPAASFAQFFPAAPRAAKDKAKERERVKSQGLDSPSIRPVDSKISLSFPRADDTPSSRLGGDIKIPQLNGFAPSAEDSESTQGDLLNGVGSASSHTSTVSSGFSAPAAQSNMSTLGGPRNVSSLTPLTNIESSPIPASSPQQKSQPTTTHPHELNNAAAVSTNSTLHANPPSAHTHTDSRVQSLNPNKGVKGIKCTYDPSLDKTSAKKSKTAIYKEFGLVRILQSVGSVILLV